MWNTEHSLETTVAPQAIWQRWQDVERWPEWNGDIEQISLDGPFAPGATIMMKPRGQDMVELRPGDPVEPGQSPGFLLWHCARPGAAQSTAATPARR